MDLYADISKKRSRLHEDSLPFLNGLEAYVLSNGKCVPDNYLGHCCIIKQHFKPDRNRELPEPLQDCKNSSDVDGVTIGGSMYLPEFQLLLPIDERSMDVFSLGKEQGIKPAWHCVIDEEFAHAIQKRGIFPKMSEPEEWITLKTKIKIQ